jgi:hypothetical protein
MVTFFSSSAEKLTLEIIVGVELQVHLGSMAIITVVRYSYKVIVIVIVIDIVTQL